ncbi:MAG: sensor histidine kinase [Bacillota bacterium]
MLKTLFSKIVVVFIVILLISTSITGAMLYVFLGNFMSQEKKKLLNETGESINSFLTSYYKNYNNPLIGNLYRDMMDNMLEYYSFHTNSFIWIVSTDGEIGVMEGEENMRPEIAKKIVEKLKDTSGRMRLKDPRQYKEVMSGQKPSIEVIGDFYGLFAETKVSWLTIEMPFRYNEEILGAVYLHTPVPEIQRARTTVFKFFMFSVTVSVIISIVLVYIFSLRLSKPLKKINEAAKLIANGEFDKRLDIASEDEIGELARSFNNMAWELQNLEEMRRGFIANVSHELRTPMTSINGFIEGILDGTIPPEKQKDYLNIVSDETKRLNRLTTDLLDLAKMESGEIKLNPVNFNINELIRRCIIKLENLILKKDIHVEASFEEEDMYVKGDMDSIERVILNLIHNAIKFVQNGGRITLTTSRHKNKVLVSVEDNGIGIESSEIDLIWERFYKSDKSRSKDKGGTGLGLAIVRNIINEHKQEIWVKSEAGKGTKFYFTLESAGVKEIEL